MTALSPKTEDQHLSVVVSTYRGDDPDELATALESVFEQTRPPDEVVLVADGPLTDALDSVVERFANKYPDLFRVHARSENRGQGVARREGIEAATNPMVAIMDADDVCRPDRFERQLDFLAGHPEVDVVGSYLEEFATDPDEPHAVREVPTNHDDIVRLARSRSPMNQVTVVCRRGAVLSAGNYRDVARLEDYGLWVRLLLDGARFANIPEPLVSARAGERMYERRGGWTYAREELRFQYECWQWGFIGLPRLLLNLATRVPIRFVPNRIRGAFYRRLFRNSA